MYTFYITNAKYKLSYYAVNIFKNQLHVQMIDSIMRIGDKLEEVTETDFEIFNNKVIIDMELGTF